MAEDGPKAEPRSYVPWSDKEFAFILNHTDYCLKNNKDYMGSILEALSNFSPAKPRTMKAVEKKLRVCLSKSSDKTSLSELRQQGTACLHLKSLPSGVLHEMASQRATLGLEALDLTDSSPSAAGGDATNPQLDGPESVSFAWSMWVSILTQSRLATTTGRETVPVTQMAIVRLTAKTQTTTLARLAARHRWTVSSRGIRQRNQYVERHIPSSILQATQNLSSKH
jgi:hypothetical protein